MNTQVGENTENLSSENLTLVNHLIEILYERCPQITEFQKNTFVIDFKKIIKCYDLFRHQNRNNFLNINCVCRYICKKNNFYDLLECFNVLKNKDNKEQFNKIMQKICEYNKWEFFE